MKIKVNSLYVGKVKTINNAGLESWTSGIFKAEVREAIMLNSLGLTGDEQADLINHGGPEKALFVYPAEHYNYWLKILSKEALVPGGMGENFSTLGQLENQVAIGDIYEIGEALIQVSQPRQPCWKPARRFNNYELGAIIEASGRTGWYYRVLSEGLVQEGQNLKLIDRPYEEWTVEKCNSIMRDDNDLEGAERLLQCQALGKSWQKTLKDRVLYQIKPNRDARLYGS